jgi:hypothetical protein
MWQGTVTACPQDDLVFAVTKTEQWANDLLHAQLIWKVCPQLNRFVTIPCENRENVIN